MRAHHRAPQPKTGLVESMYNGFFSFMVAPDGSYQGYEITQVYERSRYDFIAWMRSQAFEDGSSALHWVEVRYSPDTEQAEVERHQWDGNAMGMIFTERAD